MKIIIIGAGIAGMSAGIYARQSGFEATIFESHTIAGGNSTSWKRKGYFFEGGMHWLVGSSEKVPLHKLWREVGALQDNNPIYNRDPFLTCVYGEEKIALYRDPDKLEQTLMAISPGDKNAIKGLVKDIRVMGKASMPIMDIKGVKVKKKSSMSMSQLFGYIKAGKTMARLSKMTVAEYVSQFKHEGIRELLKSAMSLEEYSAMALLFTLGGLAEYDSGYPKGGSLRMAQNMAETFKAAGGIIEYQKKAERVNVTEGKADGVWSDGILHKADAVIVTADTLTAIDHLFEQPLHEPWMDELRKEAVPLNCTFLSLGIAADLSHLPENMIVSLKEPFHYAGKLYKSVLLNNYASYDGYAPEGCTAVTCVLSRDTYDEWKQACADGTYQVKKQELAKTIIQCIEKTIPEINGKVEVWDVATPVTYERYCGTYRGSWMSVMKPGMKRQIYPCKPEGIENLYFAGQRLMLPGGVPVALTTGRTAVQHLCKDTDTVFQNKI